MRVPGVGVTVTAESQVAASLSAISSLHGHRAEALLSCVGRHLVEVIQVATVVGWVDVVQVATSEAKTWCHPTWSAVALGSFKFKNPLER